MKIKSVSGGNTLRCDYCGRERDSALVQLSLVHLVEYPRVRTGPVGAQNRNFYSLNLKFNTVWVRGFIKIVGTWTMCGPSETTVPKAGSLSSTVVTTVKCVTVRERNLTPDQ